MARYVARVYLAGPSRLIAIPNFTHPKTGDRFVCECARATVVKLRTSAHQDIDYVKKTTTLDPSSCWGARALKALECLRFEKDACHLCISRQFGDKEAAARYSGDLRTFKDIYATQLWREGMSQTEANFEVDYLLGLSNWQSERDLVRIVRSLFGDLTVKVQASPKWLSPQRLDIFVPLHKLAIEYQGAQHFVPVELFGGEEGLHANKRRDARKARLCKKHGITLICIRHDDDITHDAIKQRLRRFLNIETARQLPRPQVPL